ncbi:MAG TPA: hypothetical protein VK164_04655 [Flavobacterium sp.]|nr:hypothetical protein [Flavobacterium sp.]HLO73206.1 hypothetical protein [Flavobacterium sp.]
MTFLKNLNPHKDNSKVKIHENRLENKIKPINLVYLKNNHNELKT